MSRSVVPFIVFVLAACACAKSAETPASESDGKSDPVAADKTDGKKPDDPKPEVKKDDGTGPAATVNGTPIPRDMFQREYDQTMARYAAARHEVRPDLKERLKDNIVRRLVDMEIIRQQAAKMGVSVPKEESDKRWSDHRKRYGTAEAFEAFLERAGTTEADIRRQFDHNLLREKVFQTVAASIEVDEAAVKKFYEDNKNRYSEPEQVRASHILFRKPPGADDKTKRKIKRKANQILKRVRRNKKKFAELAKEHSEDVTKKRGGELGWFAKGRMVPEFEKAAWALKDGQISGLVETSYGYHIIKRDGYRPARTKDFGEVRNLIERSLSARQRNQAIQQALKKWKAEAKIEIFIKGDPEIIKQGALQPPPARPVVPGAPSKMPKPVDGKSIKPIIQSPGVRTGPPVQ